MRHICSLYHHVLGVVKNEYTHLEMCTVTEQVGAVIGICDYKSIEILYTPEFQVSRKMSLYRNVYN